MTPAITAFFRTRAEGELAQNALLENGFTHAEVSFVAAGPDPTELPRIGPLPSVDSEAAGDAFIGSLLGLATGIALSVLPGAPLAATGPVASAIGGAAIGGATGGIIGLLRDRGLSEEEAELYSRGITRGGSLVTVHEVDEHRADLAHQILDKCGAIKIEEIVETPEEMHRA